MGVVIAVPKTTPFARGSGTCHPEFRRGQFSNARVYEAFRTFRPADAKCPNFFADACNTTPGAP